MRVKVWGCRGSLPTPGPETVGYGGNTSCIEVRLDDGSVLVFDAGTGIVELGLELAGRGARKVNLLLTHLHLDHLEGMRFFAPMWDPEVELDIWGPPSPVSTLRERIALSFSPPLFPIDLHDVPAQVRFLDVPREPWEVAGASLVADLVMHPGPTLGFRIEADGAAVAYVPDHEPALLGIAGRRRDWISGAGVAEEVDLLLHDAQYSMEEYEQRIGWGHSSVDDAVMFAGAVGARRLVLFHHEPRHDDEALARLEEHARELCGDSFEQPMLAREGLVLPVPTPARY
jgi:phosphoribosyl 1,2-cyclic phosphodiesterase